MHGIPGSTIILDHTAVQQENIRKTYVLKTLMTSYILSIIICKLKVSMLDVPIFLCVREIYNLKFFPLL